MANTFNLGNGNWAQKTEKLLAYNAENNNYKPLPFDFDRASTATRVNKQGLIETVATDEPRIDFLNNTKGHLLLEPQRTNLVTYSEDFSQWALGSVTITPNSAISPDGTQNASLFSHSGGSFPQIALQNITFVSSADYAPSLYVKSDGTTQVQHSLIVNGQVVNFTPTNEWVRVSDLIVSPDTSGSFVIAQNSGSAVSASFYIWGAQLEEGSYATSYIPTSGQSGGVTRSAETCNNAGNSTVFNDSEGVLYVEALLKDTGTFKTVARITATDTSTSDGLWIYFRSDNKIQSVLRVGGVDQTSILSNTQTTNEYYKVAFKYKQNDFALWVNGTEVAPDTSGNTFSADTLSKLGFILSTDINPFIGNVKDVRVYNTALTDAELIALTS